MSSPYVPAEIRGQVADAQRALAARRRGGRRREIRSTCTLCLHDLVVGAIGAQQRLLRHVVILEPGQDAAQDVGIRRGEWPFERESQVLLLERFSRDIAPDIDRRRSPSPRPRVWRGRESSPPPARGRFEQCVAKAYCEPQR
jgi:hypothetical protein